MKYQGIIFALLTIVSGLVGYSAYEFKLYGFGIIMGGFSLGCLFVTIASFLNRK